MDTSLKGSLNYQKLFESIPGLYLICLPDTPRFTVIAASDAYIYQTKTKREEIIGKGLFKVFPDNPKTSGVSKLTYSLNQVIETKVPDSMPVQRYDIRKSDFEGGGFEERYWSLVNSPILEKDGTLSFIIHRVEDVTEFIQLKQVGSPQAEFAENLRSRLESADLDIFNRTSEIKETSKRLQLVSENLRRKEHLLQVVQRREKFGSWTWDIRSNRRQWSDEMFRIFGLRPQETAPDQEHDWKFVHPDDQDFVRQSINEAIQKGKPYNIEYRILRSDGVERIVHAVGDLYFGSDNRPSEMIGTLHDVTERMKIVDSLLESEDKFRGLLETAYDSIIIVDENGHIEFANRQTKTWLGYEPEELIGRSIEILIPDRFNKSHHEKRAEYIKRPASRPMGRSLELSAKRKDGSEFPVEVSLSPFKTLRGTVVTAFLRDMTDQKRADSQQKFLAETSRILSETIDYQERIQRITSLVIPTLADWCAVYIYEDGELKIRASNQDPLIDAELVKQVVQNSCLLGENRKLSFDAIAKTGVSHLIKNLAEEILVELTAGDEICMRQLRDLKVQGLILAPMKARGHTIGIICFACCKQSGYSDKDLACANLVADRAALAIDNARLYQDAQNAIRLREDLLAIVSHDLKNPLGVIRGFNEFLLEGFRKIDNKCKEVKFTEAIARSVRQMERLIGDLLDFAKIESGSLAIEIKPCVVDQLVWDSVELVRRHFEEKSIRITVEISPNLPMVICDADRMKQVIVNLLSNAIKFSPALGVIVVGVFQNPLGIEFSVSDKGPGIPRESLFHIFDRYWQAKETAKLGTGLGLSIAKGIVESHRGRIWVESVVGRGTIFHFTLPVNDFAIATREPSMLSKNLIN
ncbi:MAG: hypothetical protein B7Y39_07810 [Bdellovibrio sp. 28-41-41]|nr:MAG: hypothetical protein B7Y39_07810 [Bdellovibrio sp. 28-41-41]